MRVNRVRGRRRSAPEPAGARAGRRRAGRPRSRLRTPQEPWTEEPAGRGPAVSRPRRAAARARDESRPRPRRPPRPAARRGRAAGRRRSGRAASRRRGTVRARGRSRNGNGRPRPDAAATNFSAANRKTALPSEAVPSILHPPAVSAVVSTRAHGVSRRARASPEGELMRSRSRTVRRARMTGAVEASATRKTATRAGTWRRRSPWTRRQTGWRPESRAQRVEQ